jgi:hypothetical protein
MKKSIVFFVLLGMIVSGAYAYDGTLWGGYDGNFTRYNYIQQASDINLARSVLRGRFGNNITIRTIFSIGEDDVDEEDVQVINDISAYIGRNFRVSNGDAFSYAVKRGNTNNGWDGWVVFSHYSSSQGWIHYLYYFEIR